MRGYVQVYTGNGKGKTTAALGLTLRAICAGHKVFFGQFVKGMKYSELKAAQYLPNLVMEQFGNDCFIFKNPSEKDIEKAKEGLKKAEEVIISGKYDLVVLDEINIALYYKLFSIDEVIKIIDNKPEHVEIVLTGRYASEEIIKRADLVTEMKEIKHYYNQGIEARVGIEK